MDRFNLANLIGILYGRLVCGNQDPDNGDNKMKINGKIIRRRFVKHYSEEWCRYDPESGKWVTYEPTEQELKELEKGKNDE